MKTLFSFLVAALFLTALSQHAFAQQSLGTGTGGMPTETFAERKARILTLFEERQKRLTTEKACVEAAQSSDDLVKCRPERPMGMGPGMGQGRPGQQ